VLGPSSEWTYDLQSPSAASRLLNTDGAKHLIERNQANALLIVRAEKIDYFRKSLPRPVFEDETGPGGFVLWWY
jgi:4-amino-4-deoxy-L-arabinose transferase